MHKTCGFVVFLYVVLMVFAMDVLIAMGEDYYFTDTGQTLGVAYSTDVALGDLDGDGDLDAFVVNRGQSNTVWINNGNGVFSDDGQSLGGSKSNGVELGDLDADGDTDAFVANGSGQANIVWLNDGSGVFTDSGQTLGSSDSSDVALGDLDDDGDLDAFVANANGDPNTVWLNDGSGVFTDSGQTLGSSNSAAVALADIDGDSDLDAVVANQTLQANTVWLNDGSGIFTDSGQSLGDSNSTDIELGDLDDDGDVDIFTTNKTDQANTVWLNNGSGVFVITEQSLGNSSSEGVVLTDFNMDGALDAYVANGGYPSNANKVWFNRGNGRFDAGATETGDSVSQGVASGNLVGDSLKDVMVANLGEANRVWKLVGPPTPYSWLRSLGSSGGGCFIATAAFGSPMEKNVVILKRFRDCFLETNGIGRTLVQAYHRYSPPAADFISRHESLRFFVRWSLLPIIGVSWLSLHAGLVPAVAVTVLLIVLITLLCFAAVRRCFSNASMRQIH